MDLASKYRPQRFEDVHGQEEAVGLLSRLITAGQLGRHLLLVGTVGSGKTTLARLYARALNCESCDSETGSPCGECGACQAIIRGDHRDYIEYDTSRLGGNHSHVETFLERFHRGPVQGRRRILFLDEAHSVTRPGFDALLKAVEDPPDDVFFIFATSEDYKIPAALRSRTMEIRVRPLSASQAIAFLKTIANRENYSWDEEGLALLAGLKHGYPRDLLIGLEQVASLGRVSVASVRAVFGVRHVETLVRYFQALSEGDVGRQMEQMLDWQRPLREKVRLVQVFLLALYYNDILGHRVTVDALIQSIPATDRRNILSAFSRRLGVRQTSDLEPFWRKMLDFWPLVPHGSDDATLLLRLAQFHVSVSEPAAESGDEKTRWADLPELKTARSSRASVKPPRSAIWQQKLDSNPAYLSKAQVREFLNAASFLVQETGTLFNAFITVRPRRFNIDDEREGVSLISDFHRQWAGRVEGSTGVELSRWTVFENNKKEGLRGLTVTHLPLTDRLKNLNEHRQWIDRWCTKRGAEAGAVELTIGPANQTAALTFHWRHISELCAGLNPAEVEWDPKIGDFRPLADLLQFPKTIRREAGVISGRRFSSTGLLSPQQMSQACFLKMDPLSAFDARAWTWLRKGWELDEHLDRKSVRQQRQSGVEAIQRGASPSDAKAALENFMSTWPDDPRQRPRRWTGWWSPSGAV